MLNRKQHRTMLILDVLNFLLAAVNLRTAMRKYHASTVETADEPQHTGHFYGCRHGHCHRHHSLRHLMLLHMRAHCRHHQGCHRMMQQHRHNHCHR